MKFKAMHKVLNWLSPPSPPPVKYETKPKITRSLFIRRLRSTGYKRFPSRPGTPFPVPEARNRALKEDEPDKSRSLRRSGSTNLPIHTVRPSRKVKAEVITTTRDSAQTRPATYPERVDQSTYNHEQPAADASEYEDSRQSLTGCDSRIKSATVRKSPSTSESLTQSLSLTSATKRSQSLRTKVDTVPQNSCFRPLVDIEAPDNSKSAHLIY